MATYVSHTPQPSHSNMMMSPVDQARCDEYFWDEDHVRETEREWFADQERSENPEFPDIGCYIMVDGVRKVFDHELGIYMPITAGEPCMWDLAEHGGVKPPSIAPCPTSVHCPTTAPSPTHVTEDSEMWADKETPVEEPVPVCHYATQPEEDLTQCTELGNVPASIVIVKWSPERTKILFYVGNTEKGSVYIPYKVIKKRLVKGQVVNVDMTSVEGFPNPWKAHNAFVPPNEAEIELTSNYSVRWGNVIGPKGANLKKVAMDVRAEFNIRDHLKIVLDTKRRDTSKSAFSSYAKIITTGFISPPMIASIEAKLRTFY